MSEPQTPLLNVQIKSLFDKYDLDWATKILESV